jgi:L-fuconolactonase
MKNDSLNFVDAHVHFWDAARMPYPWLAEVPSIAGAHGPAELTAAAGAHSPAEIVFVESAVDPARALDEVRWVESFTDGPYVGAIVAQVAVDRGAETASTLAALGTEARVRGVRHNIQGEPDPGYCLRPEFVSGVRRVGALGWTFDLCVKHEQLPACAELARVCPETTFVLDHAGKPDIRGGMLDPWRADIAALARLPNVVCKLSGLVTEADPAVWRPAALRPYVDHLLGCFGAGRLLYGSDWPVVDLAASYRRWLDAALELLAALPEEQRAAIMCENTRRVYRMESAS